MIARYIEKFIRYLEIEKNYSRHTVLNYRLDLEGFRAFLRDTPLEDIDYLVLRKYLASLKEIGMAYRDIIGKVYPVMTAIQVAAFVEKGAKVEIEATAVVPE